MHSLRTLDLGSLKAPDGTIRRILHHLGGMTSLEILHNLHIPTEVQSLDKPGLILPPFRMVNQWFPKLRDLSLSLGDFDSAALIMDSLQHLPFRFLKFELKGQHPQPHSPRKLLQSLACNHHLPLSLSTIAILEDVKQPVVHDVDDADIFRPLLSLTNLHTLNIRLSGVEMLDDAWLDKASKCFPQVQFLRLCGRALERQRITLAGYVPLVQNCPKLSIISVATACRSFEPRKALSAGLCNANLWKLDCSESSIESPVGSIFRCLNLMFLNLRVLLIPLTFHSEEAQKSWTLLQQLVHESQTD